MLVFGAKGLNAVTTKGGPAWSLPYKYSTAPWFWKKYILYKYHITLWTNNRSCKDQGLPHPPSPIPKPQSSTSQCKTSNMTTPPLRRVNDINMKAFLTPGCEGSKDFDGEDGGRRRQQQQQHINCVFLCCRANFPCARGRKLAFSFVGSTNQTDDVVSESLGTIILFIFDGGTPAIPSHNHQNR
eukprot:scaffold449_cov184-Amphora_coffeaeformis.AAC.8